MGREAEGRQGAGSLPATGSNSTLQRQAASQQREEADREEGLLPLLSPSTFLSSEVGMELTSCDLQEHSLQRQKPV